MGFTKHVVIIIIINVICYDTFFGRPLFLLTTFSFSGRVGLHPLFFLSPHLLMFHHLLFHLLFWVFVPLFCLSQHPLFQVSKYHRYFFISVLFFLVDSMHFLLFWLSTHLPSVFLCHFFSLSPVIVSSVDVTLFFLRPLFGLTQRGSSKGTCYATLFNNDISNLSIGINTSSLI